MFVNVYQSPNVHTGPQLATVQTCSRTDRMNIASWRRFISDQPARGAEPASSSWQRGHDPSLRPKAILQSVLCAVFVVVVFMSITIGRSSRACNLFFRLTYDYDAIQRRPFLSNQQLILLPSLYQQITRVNPCRVQVLRLTSAIPTHTSTERVAFYLEVTIDPRKARALLKLLTEFSKEFDEIEVESSGTVRVKRRTGQVQTAPEQPRKKQEPVRLPAIASLGMSPPVFEA